MDLAAQMRIATAFERMATALERIADAQNGTTDDSTIGKPPVPPANI